MSISGFLDSLSDLSWRKFTLAALDSLFYIIIVLIVARLAYQIIVYLLKRILVNRKSKSILDERKANTMFSLLQSIVFYLLTFTVLLHILKNLFNIDTGALLASAGVLGVALGFGAQSLVKDVIGGFFILFEDQYAVGEFIKVGEFTGTIEYIGIRATRIRAWSGELHIIPNGNIKAVTNYSRGKMMAKVEMQIPYDEDLERALKVMNAACEEVGTEFGEKIVEAPVVQGVTQFGERNVVLRVVAFTEPGEQWALERELRRQIHRALSRGGIHMPPVQSVIVAEAETRITKGADR